MSEETWAILGVGGGLALIILILADSIEKRLIRIANLLEAIEFKQRRD
jgi:hypothetical protein